MNLPNKLTVLRLIMVPIFMVVMLLPTFVAFNTTVNTVLTVAGVLLFAIASYTDMLDGKIARKCGLVTDFGKFMDPLADKFMVIGAMLCIFYTNSVAGHKAVATLYFFTLIVVIFRELAVTSIRLVASSSSGVVIAANWMGKVKTVTQIIAVCAAIIEPMIWTACGATGFVTDFPPVTFVTTAITVYLTIHSGLNYIIGAWKYLDPEK